jgi:hypothetical protein
MTSFRAHTPSTLFATEHACVTYLFQKRWPWGFKCPFCRRVQKDMAPAYTVVCRYCRKQTSITAHTLMHGSKKSLVAWMRVASQFCFHEEGISARELQRLMELSCYQTAWSWLQKIRRGAALAESAPCYGTVLFDILPLKIAAVPQKKMADICIALELAAPTPALARVRLLLLDKATPEELTATIHTLIEKDSTLLIRHQNWTALNNFHEPYQAVAPTPKQMAQGYLLLQKMASWLDRLYRGAIDPCYLQSYLDEFSFRHNTASWPDRLAVLDHLLTGLISPVTEISRAPKQVTKTTKSKKMTKATSRGGMT